MQILKSEKSTEQRLRLHYLDGLRGLAALYVVMVHINRYMGELPVFLQFIGKTLRYGNFAVAVFIVLSGYVLMLPVARSQSGYLSRGLWDYIQRRSPKRQIKSRFQQLGKDYTLKIYLSRCRSWVFLPRGF